MGAIPSTVNEPAKTADEIIHVAIFDIALNAALAAMISQFPWLGFVGIVTAVKWVLNWIGGIIYNQLANFVTFQVISIQTEAERSAYGKAEATLRAAHLSGDTDAISKATIEFRKTLASLIHFDGSYSSP